LRSVHSASSHVDRAPVAGSKTKKAVPFSVVVRYQKRSSGSHVGRTPLRRTSGVTL